MTSEGYQVLVLWLKSLGNTSRGNKTEQGLKRKKRRECTGNREQLEQRYGEKHTSCKTPCMAGVWHGRGQWGDMSPGMELRASTHARL